MRVHFVVRYVVLFALSLISLFFLDFMGTADLTGWGGSYNPPPWIPLMTAIIITRSLYAFFIMSRVDGVGVGAKELFQALAIYGPPALCSFIVLARLHVPLYFGEANLNSYSWVLLGVGTTVQEFLRGLSYSQAVRGIPWRVPLAVVIFGWHLFMGFAGAYKLMNCILYWLVVSMLAFLVFRAEGAKARRIKGEKKVEGHSIFA